MLSQNAQTGALRVQPLFAERKRPALPSHLQRLIVDGYNGSKAARFPSRVHTFACLAHFQQHYGPLLDAHVYNDPETKRPSARIDVLLSRRQAQEALKSPTQRIMLPGNGAHLNDRAFDAAKDYRITVRDLLGPWRDSDEAPFDEERAGFTVDIRAEDPAARVNLDPQWHDRWERLVSYPRADKTRPDNVLRAWNNFKGFV